MKEIFDYLQLLTIAIICNILCGSYYNINVKRIKFNKYKLLNGLVKALIVALSFIGMAYVFQEMPQLVEAIGITPSFIMISAIVLYSGKTLISLGKILGIEVKVKE